MGKKEYRSALNSAKLELEEVLKQRAEADTRIAQLKNTIEVLTALCDDTDHSAGISIGGTPPVVAGLSSNIRMALADSPIALTAVQIRNALSNLGLDLSVYANEMTVVHNTIARLEKQGEVMDAGEASGKTVWTLTDKGKAAVRQTIATRKRLFGR